jgi:sugar phosphate isomerase/epimerase
MTSHLISFMSANYVARQLNYQMTDGWMQGDGAAQDWLRPVGTFRQRFDDLLLEISALGFGAFDLWLAHLHPDWATPEHIEIARALMHKHDLHVVSLAGGFGETREAFNRTCALAKALGVTILGGGTGLLATDRIWLVGALREHGLKLGIENHPEKTPAELLTRLGVGDEDVIGVALDTGWFGTQGYDAAQALRELRARLFHVHLKDVREAGAHNTCRFGEGVVPLEACVRVLREIGYTGAVSIEHEPETFDPTMDVRASYRMVKEWFAG